MAAFSDLFIAITNLPQKIQEMLGKKLSEVSEPETEISLANMLFKGWDGEKEVEFSLGQFLQSLSLMYPGASKGYGMCPAGTPKDEIKSDFSNTDGAIGCTGQLEDFIKRWRNGEFGDCPVFIFTTKDNVKEIAQHKELKPIEGKPPFLLVTVTPEQLKLLKKLGFETFVTPSDNNEYFHRIAVEVDKGVVKSIYGFPRVAGEKPSVNQNEFIAESVKTTEQAPKDPKRARIDARPA